MEVVNSSSSNCDAPVLVTVVLMAYNQEKFIRESIQGALKQTYSPLEIIISDDASTDATWCVIQEEFDSYQGRHEVHLRRGEVNLGINGHFNELMKMANGQFIVIMAGDDISLPDRVQTSIQVLLSNQCHGMFSNGIRIDHEGREIGLYIPDTRLSEKMTWEMIIKSTGNGGAGFSMCWHRKVVEVFGDIPQCPLGEDAFIPFRSALISNFYYLQAPLVKYREHGSNASFWSGMKKDANVQARKTIANKMSSHYLKMYEKWQLDTQVALQHRYLLQDDYERICSIINNMVWLHYQRVENLNKSMASLLIVLVNKRNIYASLDIHKVVWREFQEYLAVLHPRSLSVLIALVTTARKFVLGITTKAIR